MKKIIILTILLIIVSVISSCTSPEPQLTEVSLEISDVMPYHFNVTVRNAASNESLSNLTVENFGLEKDEESIPLDMVAEEWAEQYPGRYTVYPDQSVYSPKLGYEVRLPEGNYTLLFSKEGYINASVEFEHNIVVDIPYATNLSVSGLDKENETLTGNYTYNPNDNGDQEAGTIFKWYQAEIEDGYYTEIAGATAQNYTLGPEDVNKFLKFAVIVKDVADNEGNERKSDPVGPVSAFQSIPYATEVTISGMTEVGEKLTGNYTFNPNDYGDQEQGSNYAWYRADEPDSNQSLWEFITQGSMDYIIQQDDVGKYIIFSVTVRDEEDNPGYTEVAWDDKAAGPVTEIQFAGGDGTAGAPFHIATSKQLYNVKNHLDKHFVQVNNINLDHTILANEAWYDDESGWEPISQMGEWEPEVDFTGVYDGAGYEINNLYINRESSYIGLFASTDGAVIKNITLESVNISGSSRVGALVGIMNEGTMENCSVQGMIKGDGSWTGGLVGNNSGLINNSYFTGEVASGNNYVGGLVGMNSGDIISSYATATINRLGENNDNYGGLVGSNSGVIETSYATGNVKGKSHLGGLVGSNGGSGIIKLSFATGDVIGEEIFNTTWSLGGLVGHNNGVVQNSYATGNVSGTQQLGALIGTISGSVINCYAVGETAGDGHSIGGLIGYEWSGASTDNSYWNIDTSGEESAAGEGKTTEELQQQSTYENWDFENIWIIEENNYPYLRLE